MSEEMLSKGNVPISTKPTFIEIGKNRKVIYGGVFKYGAMVEYVRESDPKKWHTVGSVSHVAFHNGSPTSKNKVRARIPKLRRECLKAGLVLLVQYQQKPPKPDKQYENETDVNFQKRLAEWRNYRPRAVAIKLYNGSLVEDKQLLQDQIKHIRDKKELTEKEIAQLQAIADAAQDFPEEGSGGPVSEAQ